MKFKHVLDLIFVVLVIILLILLVAYKPSWRGKGKTPKEETVYEAPCRIVYGLPIDSFIVVEEVIRPNTFLSQLFSDIGVSSSHIAKLNTLDRSVFDVRSIRAGKKYKALYSCDTIQSPSYWIYEKTSTDYVIFDFTDSMRVYTGTHPTRIETRTVQGTINSSLWNAMADSGLPFELALRLSDIYAWTIDFFGLQKEDSFTAVCDFIHVDSTYIGLGDIHAVLFNHAGKDMYAFAFEQDSIIGYYNQDGKSLKGAFLKAPLNYSRISSHFTHARMHPIHRVVRPHTGVDYAAPMGTPVVSIGDGVVIEKGFKGAGGHTVKIRHNSVYTTAYLHLSKYGNGINIGSRVSQGQVIGYVGSTGTSTGPHLDFRVWMNGKPINPLTMEAPASEPIDDTHRHEFDSIRNRYIDQLTS